MSPGFPRARETTGFVVSGGSVTRRWILATLVAACCAVALPGRAHAQADSTGMDWSLVPEYRIVPGDVLEFNFGPKVERPDEDLIRRQKVRIDGRIQIFPVGEIVAAGRTPAELQQAMIQLLSAEFKEPRVTVDVAEPAGNQVHVLGQVRSPGSFPAVPFVTVTEAITKAGGFTDDAARNGVLVFHRDGARNVRVSRLALGKKLSDGDLRGDVMLSRFDIVYVPRTAIGNIDVFCRQWFAETGAVFSTALVGWELFNLDRVFVTTAVPQ